jgi:HSP20 family protein
MPDEKKKEKWGTKVRDELAERREERAISHRVKEADRLLEQNWRDFESAFWEPMAWPWRASRAILPGQPWEPTSLPWRFPALTDVRTPLADVEDKGTEFVVTAEMPGIPKEDVDVTVTNDSVEIRAKTTKEEEETRKEFHRKERTFREIYRRLPLPAEVRSEATEARLEDGLLTIRLPKKEPTPAEKEHKVKVE